MTATKYETALYRGEEIIVYGTPAMRAKFPPCRPPKDEPQGYLQWHDWAKRKSRTHRQVRCREHGLYHNWTRKKAKA